jgi:protein TonB
VVSNLSWVNELTSGEAMRRSFTLFSIVVHAIAITAALIAQVLAVGTLPTPYQPVLYEAASVMPLDVQLPKPRVGPAPPQTASYNTAPTEAPVGVSAETERTREPGLAAPGLIPGVESGPPSNIEGVGMVAAAPPPPPEPAGPIRLHSGMKAPVKTTDVAPVYPVIARSAHVQGVVILEAVLNARGGVDSVHVLRSIPLLDQAAVDAVQQWRFTPALLNGRPVPVVMTVTVNFTLQ